MKISVIVPVYNTSKYLKECLDSLVNQTLKDIEIICIDDASTDNSLEILNEYSKKYPNIKVFYNENNQGQGYSRNLGINHAKGKYMAFVDSDDYINIHMYKTMWEEIEKKDYPDLVTCSVRFVKNETYLKDINEDVRKGSYKEDLRKNPDSLMWQSPSVGNKLFSKKILTALRFIEGIMYEDVAFSYAALMTSENIIHINGINYYYRRDLSDGVSAKALLPSKKVLDIFKVADFLESWATENNVFSVFEEQIRLIQVSSVLQRISEVETWKISNDTKYKIMKKMYDVMKEKYQDPKVLDSGLLSGKADIDLITRLGV